MGECYLNMVVEDMNSEVSVYGPMAWFRPIAAGYLSLLCFSVFICNMEIILLSLHRPLIRIEINIRDLPLVLAHIKYNKY